MSLKTKDILQLKFGALLTDIPNLQPQTYFSPPELMVYLPRVDKEKLFMKLTLEANLVK